MFTSSVRRLAGEIIPFVCFTVAVLASLVIARYGALPYGHSTRSYSEGAAYYRELSSDKNRFQAVKAGLVEKGELLASKYRRIAPPQPEGQSLDLSGLLQLLIQRAADASIRLDKIQPMEDRPRSEKGEFPVVLDMTTTYQSLGRFLVAIEEIPRLVSVDRLAITAGKSGLETRVLVTCYLRKGEY